MSSENFQYRPTCVHIDPMAMQHNLTVVRELCPTAQVMAVIKADGYGHGMEVAADALSGADQFGVNSLDDVLRLRQHGVKAPIVLLSASFDSKQLALMAELGAVPVIYDFSQLAAVEKLSDEIDLFVWLKADTGMGRLGFAAADIAVAYARLRNCQAVSGIGLMSHLATADQLAHANTQQQIEQFDDLTQRYEFNTLSLLNSAGVIGCHDFAHDIVRPGAMLYGISPMLGKSAHSFNLKSAMTFVSELISVKQMPAGSTIGYSGAYVLNQATRIGVVACGYGDGYPRHAKSGTPVLVNGVKVPMIGRVSMDMIVVDLGDLVAQSGDTVVLWGKDNPVETVAEYAGTIGYELVCGILPRVQRIIV